MLPLLSPNNDVRLIAALNLLEQWIAVINNEKVPANAAVRCCLHCSCQPAQQCRGWSGRGGRTLLVPEYVPRCDVQRSPHTYSQKPYLPTHPPIPTAPQIPRGTVVSHADVYALAGAAAVHATFGPSVTQLWDKVELGRVDATQGDSWNQLPALNADFTTLSCQFTRNGYTVAEMIAGSGAHAIGFVDAVNPRTGAIGPAADLLTGLSPNPNDFRNSERGADGRTGNYWTWVKGDGSGRADRQPAILPSDKALYSASATQEAKAVSVLHMHPKRAEALGGCGRVWVRV